MAVSFSLGPNPCRFMPGAAIARGVEWLSLEIILEQRLVLPRSLFSCTTLVVLILGLDILTDPPPASSTIALLSLKTLHLEHVKYANEEAFGRLLSGCPLLQNFFLTAFGLKCTNLKSLFRLCGLIMMVSYLR